MARNISSSNEIDIDSLFDDPKNIIPELHAPDYTMQDEINRVLNDALAQIDENQRIVFHPNDNHNPQNMNNNYINQSIMHDQSQVFHHHSMIKQEDDGMMKPLSPASLLSDDSQISSPNDLFSHEEQQVPMQTIIQPISIQQPQLQPKIHNVPQPRTHNIPQTEVNHAQVHFEAQLLENKKLQAENESLRKAYEARLKVLEKSIDELKKSEFTRLRLMEENRELKKIVTKLTINDQ